MVQWLPVGASTTRCADLLPGQGIRISHASWPRRKGIWMLDKRTWKGEKLKPNPCALPHLFRAGAPDTAQRMVCRVLSCQGHLESRSHTWLTWYKAKLTPSAKPPLQKVKRFRDGKEYTSVAGQHTKLDSEIQNLRWKIKYNKRYHWVQTPVYATTIRPNDQKNVKKPSPQWLSSARMGSSLTLLKSNQFCIHARNMPALVSSLTWMLHGNRHRQRKSLPFTFNCLSLL